MNLHLAKYLDRYLGILLCYLLAALHLFREMIRPLEGTIRVRRILLVKFWGIGNIVLILPIIRLVRERYPLAEIHFLTFEQNRELLEGNPHLDRLWTVDSSGFGRLLATMLRAFAGLRRSRIDLYLDFEQFARTSTLFGFLLRIPQRIGFKTPRQGRYLLYTAPVRYRDDRHMSLTFLSIARAAGVKAGAWRPEPVPHDEGNARRIDALLGAPAGPIVVLHVGSGDNFPGRRWPAASFARLTDRLVREHGIVPVFTGIRGERPLVREVTDRLEERARVRVVAGRAGLRDLAALLDRAALLVSNDTGPVHIASSLGVPVLGFYGPNTPVLYGPLSPGSRALYKRLPCSPCITNLNYKTSFCRLPVCLLNISVEEAYEAADAILAERFPAGAGRGS